MRIGTNPAKDIVIENLAYHKIVVPIYIPNLEGYFEKGLEVTQLCIASLLKTRHSKSYLTLINNGSCKEVTEYLQQLYFEKKIDQLIHYKQNVGKIDAVLPIAKTASEALITITDGDVLFKNGWMQAVENVFYNFPEAGLVSPVPNPTFYRLYSENTLFDGFFKRILKFDSVCNKEDLLQFAKSINSTSMYKKESRLYEQLIVQRKGNQAVVGCGHFVATLRNEVFAHAPKSNSQLAYASSADRDYIDIPNDKSGGWRLATTSCFAYHIGNNPEPWMDLILKEEIPKKEVCIVIPQFKKNWVPSPIKKWVNKIWLNSYFRPYFFKYLGLKQGYKEY